MRKLLSDFEIVNNEEISEKKQQVTWGTTFSTSVNSFGFLSWTCLIVLILNFLCKCH